MSVDFENDENIVKVDGINYELNNDGTLSVGKNVDEIGKYVKISAEVNDKGVRRRVVKINESALSEINDVEIIEIEDGIEEIDDWAFSGGNNLRTVKLPNGIKEIKHATFYECDKLETVIIPDSVTKIGSSAFFGCKQLSELILPESLVEIGDSAFDYCVSLKGLDIPASVTKIGDRAFDHCDALEYVKVDSANQVYKSDGVRLIEKRTNKVLYKGKTEESAKRKTKSKKEINEDNRTYAEDKKVKRIFYKDGYAFYLGFDYTAAIVEYHPKHPVSRIVLPAKVVCDGATYDIKELYGPVFFYHQELNEVQIPDGIEVIGENVFVECKNLKTVIMPNTVKKLGERVFSGCKNLSQINISTSLKALEKDAFFGCDSLKSLEIPDSVEEIGERVFGLCKGLADLTLSRSLKRIESQAFSYCDSLESVYIPASVEDIVGGAFHGCSSLASITVDDNNIKYYSAGNCVIEKAKNRVVAGCTTSVIPYGVTEIGDEAFMGCQFRYLNIPDSVVRIGDRAFEWSGLYQIYIPKSVVEIGDGAFNDCLTQLRCQARVRPDTWSPYLGLRKINYITWVASPIVIKPPKESIFKKIKKLFAKLFGKK